MIFTVTSSGAPLARADLITTDAALGPSVTRADCNASAEPRARLTRIELVRALTSEGLDPESARQQIGALSDAEARRLACEIDELPAGGSAVAVVAIVLVVLVITDYLGVTELFPWIQPREPA